MSTGVHLFCDSVSCRLGERILFKEFSVALGPGAKIGVIGENGAGKSTLLSLLAGERAPTSGTINASHKPAYVPQQGDVLPGNEPVAQVVADCLSPLEKIKEELDSAAEELAVGDEQSADRYSLALQRAETFDVWSAPQRMERYLHGLGLDDIPRDRPIDELSAGQRRRLALALTMASRPSILLLDEPSNYLDEHARSFLVEELVNWSGILVFVSHDREFLETIPTGICDLDKSRYSDYLYAGAYHDYVRQKEDELNRWEAEYESEQESIQTIKRSLEGKARKINHHRAIRDNNKKAYGARGDRVQSQVSRRVRAAREKLDRINQDPIPQPPTSLVLSIPRPPKPASTPPLVAQLRSVTVAQRLTHPVTTDIGPLDKLLITGANGAGKTTVLELLAGRILCTEGKVVRDKKVRVGFLGHDDVYADDQRTPREIYNTVTPQAAPRLTALGLLEEVDVPARGLSIGQRKRLELGILLLGQYDLLLLDEPTNHLSLRICDDLLDLLTTWPAAVAVATHDPWVLGMAGWRHLSL